MIRPEIHRDKNGLYHKEDGPAYIDYKEDDSIRTIQYYRHNTLHRADGPALTHYFVGTGLKYQGYYLNDNLKDIEAALVIEKLELPKDDMV